MANISQINGLKINAETASYALFAATVSGSVTNAVSASYAATASLLLGSVVSASYAATASYASVAQTLLGSVVSASYAATASLAPNYVLNSATSSFVTNAQTSSFVLNSQTSSFVTTTQTSSFVQNSQTSSMSVLSSATASYVNGNIFTGTNLATSASFAISASWAPSVGGGTPGGNVNEIQYNNGAGGFAGAANVEISTAGNLNLVAQTDPTTPAAGIMSFYSKDIAGRLVPKVKGPSGLDYPLQASLWQNDIYLWTQTTATNGIWQGTSGAGAGTFTSVTSPTINGTGTLYQSIRRARYANVATTANQVLGQRNADNIFFRGAATAQGGFFFYTRCGFDVWTNGGRFFAGMATAQTVISSNPSALNNTVGFCVDDTDNGAISFLTRNAATATKVSTGLTISSNKGYDIFIFNAPNSGTFGYRIIDINTGTEFSGTTTTTTPVAGTGLTANVLASNAALTTVTAIQLGVVKIYIEVDY